MKAATVYSRLGWAVVPLHDVAGGSCSCGKTACPSAGKHPRLNAWEEDATADAEVIAEWIARWPNGNVGIATGTPSGFFALDVDPDKGGNETLASLVTEHGELPATVEQITGSGGRHFLFKLPADFTVRNSAKKLGRGLDTRGDGGQIVVAPSVSSKGSYRWTRPPWKHEIVDAPEWLLELLKAKVAKAPEVEPVVATYPPASPEVLDDARAALVAHGPATQGEGGDHHTFVAAAMLRHDFALTRDEAWPLLLEWNETCAPPWDEAALVAKLDGGAKYATGVYGAKRTRDANQTVTALIAEWNAGPRGEESMFALIDKCRPIIGVITDPARHAVAVAALVAATGLNERKLGLPDAAVEYDEPPPDAITVTPALHEAADAGTAAIRSHVFARNGVLCEIIREARQTFISDLENARVYDLLSAGAKWVRAEKDGGMVTIAPPEKVAQIIHARRAHKQVRVLESVTTAPIFLRDGSILQERGYNPEARVFLEPSVFVDVLEEPTRDDARGAVGKFERLVCDFPLLGHADFSSWLAGVLTPLVKAAIDYAPAPLFVVSAAVAASGKTKLTNLASLIVTGEDAEISPYNPRDPGEWGKRLTAFVRMASPVRNFDNVNGPIGDEALDRLITSNRWSDRILGGSDAQAMPNATTWWATGNNIEPQGDTVRRVLMIRLDTKHERPQERTDFAIPGEIEDHVRENRAGYLSAALTILRAFHVAGRPVQGLPSWGSFTTWSALVRGALVWCGCVDPFLTQKRAADELNEDDNAVHDFWLSLVPETDGTAGAIAALANSRQAAQVLGLRETLTAHTLKKFLARFVDRPRGGQRIRRTGAMWRVEAV